jgi:signal transduction histidine kinase
MLDDVGLVPTLRWHFDRYEKQTGVHVAYTLDGISESLPQELETAAYRILQEALTNVARYANVKAVDVTLAIRDESLWVEVADKGPGFDLSRITEKPSSGLGGMRERAELAGGYLLVYSTPSQGTQIIAVLPIGETRLERRKNVR